MSHQKPFLSNISKREISKSFLVEFLIQIGFDRDVINDVIDEKNFDVERYVLAGVSKTRISDQLESFDHGCPVRTIMLLIFQNQFVDP